MDKNNAPFRPCISKISSTFIDDAEDYDIFMPMYNLLEYSDNKWWDEIKDDANENSATDNRINNHKTTTSKSFDYKTKLIESMRNDSNTLDADVVVPLKYLSNF